MTESAESKSAAQYLSGLINKGQPQAAIDYGTGGALTDADTADANFWFMTSLAYMLVGDTPSARKARERAAECENYSSQMEGDFHRDAAIAALKQGDVELAYEELTAARGIHSPAHDWLRVAGDDMVQARIWSAKKEYATALVWHNYAEYQFNNVLKKDPENETALQWSLNNRFHRLLTRAHLPKTTGTEAEAFENDFVYVVTHSGNLRQRIGAWMALLESPKNMEAFERMSFTA